MVRNNNNTLNFHFIVLLVIAMITRFFRLSTVSRLSMIIRIIILIMLKLSLLRMNLVDKIFNGVNRPFKTLNSEESSEVCRVGGDDDKRK